MGLAGAHLLVLLIVPVVFLAAVAVSVYFLVKRAAAAGVRKAQREPGTTDHGAAGPGR